MPTKGKTSQWKRLHDRESVYDGDRNLKRRVQNRKAQRDFRNRQKHKIEQLETQLREAEAMRQSLPASPVVTPGSEFESCDWGLDTCQSAYEPNIASSSAATENPFEQPVPTPARLPLNNIMPLPVLSSPVLVSPASSTTNLTNQTNPVLNTIVTPYQIFPGTFIPILPTIQMLSIQPLNVSLNHNVQPEGSLHSLPDNLSTLDDHSSLFDPHDNHDPFNQIRTTHTTSTPARATEDDKISMTDGQYTLPEFMVSDADTLLAGDTEIDNCGLYDQYYKT